MQSLAIALGIEQAFGPRAGLTPEDAVGLKGVPIAQMREHRARVQQLDVLANTAAAAPAAGTACIRDKAEMANTHGIEGLVDRNGDDGAVHHGRHALENVLAVAPAIAGQGHVVHYECLAGAIVNAADVRVRLVREGTHGAPWQRLRERAVDGIENPDLQDWP